MLCACACLVHSKDVYLFVASRHLCSLLAVQAIIAEQWRAYGSQLVVKELLLHVLLLVLFGTYCLLLPHLLHSFQAASPVFLLASGQQSLNIWRDVHSMAAVAALVGAGMLVLR